MFKKEDGVPPLDIARTISNTSQKTNPNQTIKRVKESNNNLSKYVMILLVNMMNIKSYYQQNISLSFMFPS